MLRVSLIGGSFFQVRARLGLTVLCFGCACEGLIGASFDDARSKAASEGGAPTGGTLGACGGAGVGDGASCGGTWISGGSAGEAGSSTGKASNGSGGDEPASGGTVAASGGASSGGSNSAATGARAEAGDGAVGGSAGSGGAGGGSGEPSEIGGRAASAEAGAGGRLDGGCPGPMTYSELPLDSEETSAVTRFEREIPANVLAPGVALIPTRGANCIGAKLTSDLALFADCPFVIGDKQANIEGGVLGRLSFTEFSIKNRLDHNQFAFAALNPWGENRPVAWSTRRVFPNEPVTVLRLKDGAIHVAHSSLPAEVFANPVECGCSADALASSTGLVFGADAHLIAFCSIDPCDALSHCAALADLRRDWDDVDQQNSIQELAFADLDGDGRSDVVALSRGQITGRLSDGSSFQGERQYFGADPQADSADVVGDLNGDGRADFAKIGNGISVYPQQANTFANPIAVTTAAIPAIRARVAHVVPQGAGEIVVLQASKISVSREVTSGAPRTETWFSRPPAEVTNFDVRDVTGDGLDDVVLGFADHVAVMASTGTAFAEPTTWLSGVTITAPGWFFADVTGDGLADAIRVDIWDSRIYPSNGTQFETAAPWSEVPLGERGNYFADVTGDGLADAIVHNQNNILVLRSTGTDFGALERWSATQYLSGGY
jgi:hypothetical protein